MNVFVHRAMVGSALLAILTSCSTTVLEHEASPNASKQSFINDGLVILGCTAIVDSTGALVISDEMCPALAASLSKEEKAVKVTPWKDARAALGDKARLYLLEVEKTGALSAAQIDSVAAALPKSRYVIVHRIEKNEIDLDEDDYYESVNGKQVKTGKTYQTKRTMVASFWIYDLKTHERMWTATIDGNKQAEQTVTGGVSDTSGSLGGVLDALGTLDDVFGTYEKDGKPYPNPPSSFEVMQRIYGQFSDWLFLD